jgi:hypothetical protein
VPEFVGDIHDTIRSFLNGGIETLGAAVSDVTPGGDDSPAPTDAADGE